MLDEAMRHRLHSRFEEVLGAEEAAALMSVLPGIDLATRTDLADLRGELRADIAEFRGEMRTDMADLRGELRADIAEFRGEMRTGMAGTVTAQTRQVFFGLIGVVATFGGLIIAAAHIH